MPKLLQIPMMGYSVVADVYESEREGPVLLSLIGRTSSRKKHRYHELYERLADSLGITTVIFDYSGHGDSPYELSDLSPAQHLLEVVAVFDLIRETLPGKPIIVLGSSYGGFLAMNLTQYRDFHCLVLRAPSIYPPEDFYTKEGDEDRAAVMRLRTNPKALTAHPLFSCAKAFKGKSFLMVHELDERIPKEVTDAYAKALKPNKYLAKGVPHSLDDATKEQLKDYDDALHKWLRAHACGD